MTGNSAQHGQQPQPSAHSSTTSDEQMPPPQGSVVKKKALRTAEIIRSLFPPITASGNASVSSGV